MAHFSFIDQALVKFFKRYGRFVARHPLAFLLGSLLMAAGLSAGLMFIELESDVTYLFTPDKSEARTDSKIVYELFPVNYTDYLPNRGMGITDNGADVIILHKDGDNLLTEEGLSEILRFDEGVRNVAVTDLNDTTYVYSDLCSKWQGSCLVDPVLNAYNYDASFANKINLTHPIYVSPETGAIFVAASLPEVTLRADGNEFSVIEKAEIYAISYSLLSDSEFSLQWEDEFAAYANSFESDSISVYFIVSDSIDNEMRNLTFAVIPNFIIAVVMLTTFSIGSCFVADWVLSKSTVAIMGLNSAVLAVGASAGLLCYIGIPLNVVAAAMPFLIVGIGIDDMFIMIAAWRKTNPLAPVEERMALTFSEAAVSITITSITDALAFGIGAISPLPAVRVFCLYTGVGVIFDYLFQITFFGACMVYSGRREAANRHCITLRKVVPRSEAKSKWYKFFCAGGFLRDDPNMEKKDTSETALMAFFRDHYGPALMKPAAKVLTFLLFFAYLGGAIYGFFQIEEGLELKKLAGEGSQTHTFFDLQTEYFTDYGPSVYVVINETLDYSDPSVQSELEDIVQDFESSKYLESTYLTEFWLTDYLAFLSTFQHLSDEAKREQFMNILTEQFLELPQFAKYHLDIKFKAGSNGTIIEASRFVLQGDSLLTTSSQVAMMNDARGKAEDSSFNLIAFSPLFFLYEQFKVIRPLTIQNISIAVACMFLVALLFIPHLFCAVMVTACIVSIQVGIIGYMALWDVSLDGISLINIILCIGFSVDFSAHITYSFLSGEQLPLKRENQKNLTPLEKQVVLALYSLGQPVLQGALSTIISIVVLSFSASYIFQVFFKIMLLVMTFGMLHSLVFLPVMLCTFGKFLCVKPMSSRDHYKAAKPAEQVTEKHNHQGNEGKLFRGDGSKLLVDPSFGGMVTVV